MSESIRFCSRCVISTQRPLACKEYQRTPGSDPAFMAFDQNGICAACRVAERKKEDTPWPELATRLRELCAHFRRHDGRPDVLVPGSGGKDSFYAAHLLRDTYSMHPLTVTWAPHEYTAVGWRNYQAWLQSGFSGLLVTPNPRVHRTLTRLAFLNLLHPFQPFILGQRSIAPKIAAQYGIALVAYGEDDEEYEGRPGWQSVEEDRPAVPYLGGVALPDLIHQGMPAHDLSLYLPEPHPSVTTCALGHYVQWQPQGSYYAASQHGFEANEARTEGTYSKYNSIDDRLDPLHYFTMWIKWGIGRATHDASQEIRNGHLTREEGLALVERYDGELRAETLMWACQYMGITADTFWETIDRFRIERPHLWMREECGKWLLKSTAWNPERGQRI